MMIAIYNKETNKLRLYSEIDADMTITFGPNAGRYLWEAYPSTSHRVEIMDVNAIINEPATGFGHYAPDNV